jgi:hypothetical protein
MLDSTFSLHKYIGATSSKNVDPLFYEKYWINFDLKKCCNILRNGVAFSN